MTGLLAGLAMTCTLDGDASLRGRPVARIIEPLRSMGAVLHARSNDSLPPLTVIGHTPLRAIDVRDVGAERTGEVGDPAGGAAGEWSDDGSRVDRDSRSHGTDAACPGRARRADGRAGWLGGLDDPGRVGCADDDGTGPGRRLGGGVLARRGRDPPRCRAAPAGRRDQPDPPCRDRHPALDGGRYRGASGRGPDRGRARHHQRRRRRRARGRPHGPFVGVACHRARSGRRRVRDRRDPDPVSCRESGDRHDGHPRRGRATQQGSPTGSPGSPPGWPRSGSGSRSTATTSASRAMRSSTAPRRTALMITAWR